MLGAVLRVPAPIPSLLPATPPARPFLLLRHRRGLCAPPEAPMADAGATKPHASPAAAAAPAPVPEPPEKPLPGDCCGSGCVRCVWDVYYDELDEYNKALAAAQPSSGDKASSDSKPSHVAKS